MGVPERANNESAFEAIVRESYFGADVLGRAAQDDYTWHLLNLIVDNRFDDNRTPNNARFEAAEHLAIVLGCSDDFSRNVVSYCEEGLRALELVHEQA